MRDEYDFSKMNAIPNPYTRSGLLDGKEGAREKAMEAFKQLRRQAAENGYMTDEEIEAEIQAARHGDK